MFSSFIGSLTYSIRNSIEYTYNSINGIFNLI
nr:MAG TPA: hypothetical protein [Caudoviricetes sp.]